MFLLQWQKRTLVLMIAFMTVTIAGAQFRLLKKEGPDSFIKSLEMVVMDFPYNFSNVKGSYLISQAEIDQYTSRVNLPGADTTIITYYHSEADTTASWHSVMFVSPEFEKAAQEYRRLFAKLKGARIHSVDGSSYFLEGRFDQPAEELDFVVSTLRLKTNDYRFHEFSVELELRFELQEWLVSIYMGSKKADDEVEEVE